MLQIIFLDRQGPFDSLDRKYLGCIKLFFVCDKGKKIILKISAKNWKS